MVGLMENTKLAWEGNQDVSSTGSYLAQTDAREGWQHCGCLGTVGDPK